MDNTDLKQKLTEIQYYVTCENGTEPAFNNEYWDNKAPGIYVDIVSGEPLFSSTHKYASGTGWPSFFQPLVAENIIEKDDLAYGIQRIEVRSRGGDSHLGHLFNDGPGPTGLRYCINSASLRFIPADKLVTEGYAEFTRLFPGFEASGDVEPESLQGSALATFGGGCFWCLEAVFERVEGVLEVKSGYAGGTLPDPTYQLVSSGSTGHAEVVNIKYDPAKVTYEQLLDIFWKAHDPTTLNRQGADAGTQYRSVILYHSDEQASIARRSLEQHLGNFSRPIVTEIVELDKFYPAESYHQDYFDNNRRSSYCQFVIEPKLEKLSLPFQTP